MDYDPIDYDPITAIRVAEAEERRQRESERTIAAAFRRAVKLDMIPLALALLDADAEWTHYADGQGSVAIFASAENYDAINAVHPSELRDLFQPLAPAGTSDRPADGESPAPRAAHADRAAEVPDA